MLDWFTIYFTITSDRLYIFDQSILCGRVGWNVYIYMHGISWSCNISYISMMTSWNGNILHIIGHLSRVNSPHKGQWHGALMFSLICIWINGWVNNGEAGDLRRHHAHYDVIIMRGVESGQTESQSIMRKVWLHSSQVYPPLGNWIIFIC